VAAQLAKITQHKMSSPVEAKTKSAKATEDNIEEPPDLSLEEQAGRGPARDLDSKTEDFETNATLAGLSLC
jgi:hypothetical protein